MNWQGRIILEASITGKGNTIPFTIPFTTFSHGHVPNSFPCVSLIRANLLLALFTQELICLPTVIILSPRALCRLKHFRERKDLGFCEGKIERVIHGNTVVLLRNWTGSPTSTQETIILQTGLRRTKMTSQVPRVLLYCLTVNEISKTSGGFEKLGNNTTNGLERA